MRKIYSLVLMAAALLVGTNAWADVLHATQQSGDEAKVKINDGAWQYATHLKDAFDAVEMDQTAEIVLLDNVTLTRQSGNENYGITLPSTIEKADLSGANAKAGPNITLDMNGKQIETGTGLLNDSITIFRIVKGSLNITGTGKIYKPGSVAGGENSWSGSSTITIGGTNDKTAANWSSLTIGENVTVEMKAPYYSWLANNKVNWWKAKAIAVAPFAVGSMKNKNDLLYTTQGDPGAQDSKFGYYTRSEKGSNSVYYNKLSSEEQSCMGTMSTWGAAYGVNVTIAGTVIGPLYGLHVHGNINSRPTCAGDNANFPHILVTSTAHIQAADTCGTTGIYSAGYSIMEIHGEVTGATGIYMKSGDITLTDAVVESTYEGNTINYGGNSGLNGAGGSGIAIESSENYAGDMGISVQGDTKVTGGGGYAIYDQVTAPDGGSTTSHITIEGGTIEGGSEGAIAIASGTVDVTSIAGGNIDGTQVQVTDYSDPESPTKSTVVISNFIPEGTHTTTVEVNGKTTVVISQGAAPTEYDHVYGNAKDSVKWVGTGTNATETLADNLTLKELEINQSYAQVLTIPSTKTLTVGHLIMGENAQIIVEAGAKLLVTGTQGMVAPVTSNLVLKATATSQATFVIAPEVTSNKQPKGSVEYYTKAYGIPLVGTSTNYKWDRLTSPLSTYSKISHNYAVLDPQPALLPGESSFKTFIEYYDEVNAQWVGLTAYNQMQAFTSYALSNNTQAGGITYTFAGNLQGNVANNIELDHAGWNYMGNAFLAPVHVKTMLEAIKNSGAGIDPSLYLWDMNNQKYQPASTTMYTYFTTGTIKEIPAMQTFIIKLASGNSALLDLNYAQSVYNYVINPTSYNAPQRAIATDVNVFRMNIMSVNGEEDDVYMVESDEFTVDYDSGADIVKYMNNGINFYAEGEDKYSMVASDDILGTMFSLKTTEAINYTLTFAEVRGEEYALRDNMTGRVINITEGATYNFYAQSDETIEGRFEIVSRQEMPTAIETVEETVNTPKAIYTIMGQYVGQDWNTLPAGVYVVDGVKVVK